MLLVPTVKLFLFFIAPDQALFIIAQEKKEQKSNRLEEGKE